MTYFVMLITAGLSYWCIDARQPLARIVCAAIWITASGANVSGHPVLANALAWVGLAHLLLALGMGKAATYKGGNLGTRRNG